MELDFWLGIPVINILLALRELLLDRVIIEHVARFACSLVRVGGNMQPNNWARGYSVTLS